MPNTITIFFNYMNGFVPAAKTKMMPVRIIIKAIKLLHAKFLIKFLKRLP